MEKVIGEGSYGCVVKPPIVCKKSKLSKKNRSRAVGKIIKIRNAKIEIKMSTYLKGIPGWERYYIVEEKDDCSPSNFKKIKETYIDQCKILERSSDKDLVQLLAPYGGRMLFDMPITRKFNFIQSFRHMLEGVDKLMKQGICHFDLHNGNILVDYHGTMRMIDFGSAFLGDQTTEETVVNHTYAFSPDYPPLSPEVSVQQGIVENISLELAIQQVIQEKKVFRKAESLLGLSRYEQQKDLYRFFMESPWEKKTDSKDEWIEFYKQYWKKWDTWAIGVLFLSLLEKSFLLPSFITQVWATKGSILKRILRGLLQADPRKRLTAEEALEILKEINVYDDGSE